MKTDICSKFEEKIRELCEFCGYDWYTVGHNLEINTYITINPDDGFLWFRENEESFRRVKTTINIFEGYTFRKEIDPKNGFYLICPDDTGLHFYSDGIYYCIDGSPSGWGTVYEHFKRFPNGKGTKEEIERSRQMVIDWAKEHNLI